MRVGNPTRRGAILLHILQIGLVHTAPSRPRPNSFFFIRMYLEAGTSFDYWSTKKRHNNLPTLLPSLRQHPSPFRQAGEFIRTKFWKIFEVQGQGKGRLYYLGRFCLIIGLLLFTHHKFWEWIFTDICHSVSWWAKFNLYWFHVGDSTISVSDNPSQVKDRPPLL